MEETGDPEILTRINSYEMAYRMQTSAPELMDVSNEPARTFEDYGCKPGDSSFASNCILAMQTETIPKPGLHDECVRCGKCTEVCPAQLLPQQLYWHARARAFDKVQDYHLFDCIECGCCAYVCPSNIPLTQYFRIAKAINRERIALVS